MMLHTKIHFLRILFRSYSLVSLIIQHRNKYLSLDQRRRSLWVL